MYDNFYARLTKAPTSVAISVSILVIIMTGLLVGAWVTICVLSPWLAISITILICSTRLAYWYYFNK